MDQNKNPEDKPEKANLDKKPSLRMKTGPPVRQTLTSYKRMLKANPILQLQEAGIDINDVLVAKSLGSSLKSDSRNLLTSINDFKKPESKPLKRTESLKYSTYRGVNLAIGRPTVNDNSKKTIQSNISKPKSDVPLKPIPKMKIETKKPSTLDVKAKVNSFPKGAPKPKLTENKGSKLQTNPKDGGKPLRRSLSSGHLQNKKGYYYDPKQAYTKLNHSQSEDHLCVPVSNAFEQFSPIMEDKDVEDKNFVFRTPSAYYRRSICHYTPRSNRKNILFQASTPAPLEMQRLQERLNKWLRSRGKPPASFHHLRIFGSTEVKKSPPLEVLDDEDKENVETIQEKSNSYENLNIITTPEKKHVQGHKEAEGKKEISEEHLSKYAKEAMIELVKLINEDYPRGQCIGWLELIKNKYTKIDDEPEYWECRAAIEQSAGNVQNAVEFYKTAIIQGAEVKSVDKSLDQLLQKFSLLDISPKEAEKKNAVHDNKERIVREARNVFKSSIIQFAIRERNMKKTKGDDAARESSKKLVAIPVRRSTRLSRSGYINTSGVTLCTSLKEINLSGENVGFEKNKALC